MRSRDVYIFLAEKTGNVFSKKTSFPLLILCILPFPPPCTHAGRPPMSMLPWQSTQTCLQIIEAEFNGSSAQRPSLVLERSRRGKRKVQEASYEIDPQIDISMVYVKVIKAASSTTGGVARRVCVYFKLNHCTNAVFPGRKLEPGLWANHRSYKKLNGQLQRMAKPRFTYTILRDPAKRSMSYYYHFTASKKVRLFFDGSQNISLTKGQPHDGEKLEKIKYQKNWQYHYTCLPTDGKRFENGGETVESCMSHYDFVGLAERYDESMLVLRSRMMARFGKPIPMNRFWYVSSKVASDRGGRSDGAGFRFVHHKPLDQESRALQDYIANEYMADNTIDYEMIDRINKDLDVHIQAAGPQFATDLHVFKCQMKVAATVCGHHTNNQKMKCYWNDNGCNYLCLDMVADYINRDGKDVVKMAGDTEGHADILEMTRLWNVEGGQAAGGKGFVDTLSKMRLLS